MTTPSKTKVLLCYREERKKEKQVEVDTRHRLQGTLINNLPVKAHTSENPRYSGREEKTALVTLHDINKQQ